MPPWIQIKPGICDEQPHIRGTGITLREAATWVLSGDTNEDIIAETRLGPSQARLVRAVVEAIEAAIVEVEEGRDNG